MADVVALLEKWNRLAELYWQSTLPVERRERLELSVSESIALEMETRKACVCYHLALCEDFDNNLGFVPKWAEKALHLARTGDRKYIMGRYGQDSEKTPEAYKESPISKMIRKWSR